MEQMAVDWHRSLRFMAIMRRVASALIHDLSTTETGKPAILVGYFVGKRIAW
jgi:hypothetical protein